MLAKIKASSTGQFRLVHPVPLATRARWPRTSGTHEGEGSRFAGMAVPFSCHAELVGGQPARRCTRSAVPDADDVQVTVRFARSPLRDTTSPGQRSRPKETLGLPTGGGLSARLQLPQATVGAGRGTRHRGPGVGAARTRGSVPSLSRFVDALPGRRVHAYPARVSGRHDQGRRGGGPACYICKPEHVARDRRVNGSGLVPRRVRPEVPAEVALAVPGPGGPHGLVATQ